jgi:hypothetical protein
LSGLVSMGGLSREVIPGPAASRNPESILTERWLWIPGSPLRGAPE